MDPEVFAPAYQALSRGDLDTWLAGLHEDAELHELAEMPDTAVYRGHADIRRWAEENMSLLPDWEWVPEEVLHATTEVVVVGVRLRGRGLGSGAPVDQRVFHVIEFRDGKTTRIRGFLNGDQALVAAGAA